MWWELELIVLLPSICSQIWLRKYNRTRLAKIAIQKNVFKTERTLVRIKYVRWRGFHRKQDSQIAVAFIPFKGSPMLKAKIRNGCDMALQKLASGRYNAATTTI